MKATLIDGNGLHELNLTNDSITAVYIPSSVGGATINIVAIGSHGQYAIPDGTGLTESKALFTGKDVMVAAEVSGYTADFYIETAQ